MKRTAVDDKIRDAVLELIAGGKPGQRLPRVRDLMARYHTSQRVVQRALAPLREQGLVSIRRGAGLTIADGPAPSREYDSDCQILYRSSESRLARNLLMELVKRLKRSGLRVGMIGFTDEMAALEKLKARGQARCCLLQTNFEIVSVRFLAGIMDHADRVVIDGVSVTGIDADVIGTNWREALSVAYRKLRERGHEHISFLTSSHGARQIAMARREFDLLSGWTGPDPNPQLFQVDRLPGSYRPEDVLRALPVAADTGPNRPTALIIWGLVDGYMLDAALRERGIRPGSGFSILLLGSIDMLSEHVDQFDVVGNSNAEKLDLFERVVRARINGDASDARTHYFPIYHLENGSIEVLSPDDQIG
ncbi:GntR family transcriptional regulator [Amaricoccus tamworthensis]|uniref:GntR family transcriptional regulator n=1 Tax=Amaricoccus tamworthensis TaxID=57002 RepID=UPI003C7E48E1